MGQPATLVIDIETVGQDLDTISARAREILLDSGTAGTEEDRQKILDGLGLDPCTGRIICIGLHWMELDRSRVYCQDEERELLAMTDELTDELDVSDETWAALAARYEPGELVELVLTCTYYSCVSRTLRALRLPVDPDDPALAGF